MTNYTPTPLDDFLAAAVREAEAARAKASDSDDEQSGTGDEDDIVVEGQAAS